MPLFLSKIPLTIWIAAVIGVWGGYGHLKANRLQSSWDQYRLAQVEIAREAERQVSLVEAKKLAASRNIEDKYYASNREAKKAAASLDIVNKRLQSILSNSADSQAGGDSTAICGINGERGRSIERLLGESTELVKEGSGRVRELSGKISALQQYIKQVCLSNTNANH